MNIIYKNKVKEVGSQVHTFDNADFLIIFGDRAPAELKDFCYSVDVNPIEGTIQPGDILRFDDQEYTITCIGDEAPVTLQGLGHCTIRFNGATTAELPGTMYVEQKALPNVHVGTKIQIVRP